MVGVGEVGRILRGYDSKRITVATIGSHSALNIFKGAREEGFRTVCVCAKGRDKLYRRFGLGDEYIILDKLQDITSERVQEKLRKLNSIVIPHGSFNAYIDQQEMEELRVPIMGNRKLLEVETSRIKQHEWMRGAGLKVPRIFDSPKDIKDLAFVKFPGAKGGKGYFVVDSEDAYKKKIKMMLKKGLITEDDARNPYIQEYIIGVNVYPHYFHSPLKGVTEFLGVDKRYESSVDGVFRIPVPEQLEQEISPSFSIVGNFPMVLRESLLDEVFDMGERIVRESKRISPPGLIGAFCMETIIRENLEIVAFEISSRIVAGCNALIGTNPYMYLMYDEPMYMGKRIAREIKEATRLKRLDEIVT
ncbi:MAG: formate--phosphoribosylaminoimidazolecarboxamide ligase [Candidatus Altiarchaeota archaeon]